MFKRLGWSLLCLTIGLHPLRAQSPTGAEKAFGDDIIHKRFFLCCLSADPTTVFQWTPSGLTLPDPKVQSIAIILPDTVSVRPNDNRPYRELLVSATRRKRLRRRSSKGGRPL